MRKNPLLWSYLLVLTLGLCAHAEAPRDQVAHAYRLLKGADADYDGHRLKAMEELRAAGPLLFVKLEGDAPEKEHQWLSNARLAEARRLLQEARRPLQVEARERAVKRLDKAIEEIDLALKSVSEAPREELAHAYRLLKEADADYGGHRLLAMEEIKAAAQALSIKLDGDAPERGRQWLSDARLAEARRLLQEARNRLEAEDANRVAKRVDKAIEELDLALKIK